MLSPIAGRLDRTKVVITTGTHPENPRPFKQTALIGIMGKMFGALWEQERTLQAGDYRDLVKRCNSTNITFTSISIHY